jgi:hypothetical protein
MFPLSSSIKCETSWDQFPAGQYRNVEQWSWDKSGRSAILAIQDFHEQYRPDCERFPQVFSIMFSWRERCWLWVIVDVRILNTSLVKRLFHFPQLYSITQWCARSTSFVFESESNVSFPFETRTLWTYQIFQDYLTFSWIAQPCFVMISGHFEKLFH